MSEWPKYEDTVRTKVDEDKVRTKVDEDKVRTK